MRSLLVGCFGAAAVGSTAALGPKRALLDSGAFTVNKFGLVDLSGFPMDARGVVDAGQTVQGSGLGIEAQENTTPSFGTYKLSPVAASALSDAITALPEPAEESLTATVTFPGPILRGDAGDAAPSSRATLPTVLDLSRSGDRIPLAAISAASGGYGDPEFEDPAGDPTPDSTQLIFSQFVVHAPGGVYSTFEADGIPDIADSIDFGVGSRFCLINSILLLRSCDGFAEQPATVLCCSASACRPYTQAGYEDLGFDISFGATLPVLQCAETDPDFEPEAPSGLPSGPAIPDGEPPLADAAVFVADFSTWPGSDGAPPIIEIDETRLEGRVPIRSFQTDILPGAFSLSSDEAAEIAALVAELPEIPAAEATVVDVVDFPGIEARGATTTAAPARRIPTVYSPFTAGFRATLVEPMDEETTVFNLSNMTFLVANSTYEGLGESGLLNFFGLQDGQENDLLCVQNSIFVLQSCAGFRQAEFGLWCCNAVECNREFTSEFLLAVGAIQNPLEPLTCVEIGA